MKKFSLILISAFTLLFMGCKTVCLPVEKQVIHDTVLKDRVVIIHDTVFKTPATSVKAKVALSDLKKDDFKPVLKAFKNAKLHVTKNADSLTIDCLCDTVKIKAQLRETIINEYRSKHELIKQGPVEIKYVPKWIQFFAYVGGAFLIAIIALLIFNYLKK